MATISVVARLFDVDRDTVRKWVTWFAEHMSLTANPPRGKERQFNEADLRVMALVASLWEENPDIENIHAMLNCGEQNEERFNEFARLHTPIFQEVPDDIDDTWQHGVLIGGMAGRNLPQVARAYKSSADELVQQTLLTKYEPHEIDYPIFFLYRQAIEVYLKAMLKSPPYTHDLGKLLLLLEQQVGTKIAPWIMERLLDFQRIDQHSDLFRYADDPADGELWIDFHQLKTVMDRLVEAFEGHLSTARQKIINGGNAI